MFLSVGKGSGAGSVGWLSRGIGRLGRSVGLGVSTVCDIGDVARVVVGNGVGHGLDAAVGKKDMVLAVGGITVPSLVVAEVDAVVVVEDLVAISVVGGGRLIMGGFVCGTGGLVGGGRRGWPVGSGGWVVGESHSGESSESNNDL